MEEQHPLESQKAWAQVADAIRKGDYDLIHNAKSELENAQRELRKTEEANNAKWNRRWFDEVDYSAKAATDDDIFVKLSKMANLSIKNVVSGIDADSSKNDEVETMSHWRFVPENFDNETEIKI